MSKPKHAVRFLGGTWYSWLVSMNAAFGGFLFGYEVGILNSVLEMDPFKLFFGLADWSADRNRSIPSDLAAARTSHIFSFFLLGCIPGSLFIAAAAHRLGRKRSIWIGSAPFTAGALIQAAIPTGLDVSSRIAMMLAGRFLTGVGIGILSMAVPLYIAELAPADIRGRLTSVQQLMITIGIAFAASMNAVLITTFQNAPFDNDIQWRLALGLQAAPALLLLAVYFFLPESPRWLMVSDREEEALATLAKLREQSVKSQAVQEEFFELKTALDAERAVGTATWRELGMKGVRERLVMSVLLQFFQVRYYRFYIVGMTRAYDFSIHVAMDGNQLDPVFQRNSVCWYGILYLPIYMNNLTIKLPAMGFAHSTAITTNVIISTIVNVLATLPGMVLIDRAGRRKLLIVGAIGMSVCMWLMCIFVNLFESASGYDGVDIPDDAPIPGIARVWSMLSLISCYTYIAFFAATWGPTVWVYQSEIFPMRVRSKGTGLATTSNWINNYIISAVWPFVSRALTANQYAIFAVFGIIMAMYVYKYVPETMGRTLEEMDAVFGVPSDAVGGGRSHGGADLKA
ncbi:general substrate transporter [Blastocladiella britannica]|nr:general substrate transporter [Blastocladiella britannica]